MNQAQISKATGIDRNSPVMIFLAEISLAGNYRFRVIATGATLELLITTLIKHYCKEHAGEFTKFTFGHKLLILHKMRILSDARYRLLYLFKKLRNDAAHEHKFEITKETLSKFPITIKTDREHYIVFHICMKMVIELWNEHSKVLTTYFNEEPHKQC